MSFSFDFSGDDIDSGSDEEMTDATSSEAVTQKPTQQEWPQGRDSNGNSTKAKREDIKELLSSLPSRISYTSLLVTSPKRKRKALIPRRALFDVKIQIMAESDDGDIHSKADTISDASDKKDDLQKQKNNNSDLTDSKAVAVGLGDSDIEKDVYEGGFKSWEGAVDLAKFLLDGISGEGEDNLPNFADVVELGCGTAIPTLVLFQYALDTEVAFNFTLADYNESVLRLVTLPNLILVWALQHAPESFSPCPPSLDVSPTATEIVAGEGDLDVTPALLEAFASNLVQRHIGISFISGPWSALPYFTSLIQIEPNNPLLIVAAETIYSPTALQSFSSTLLALLKSTTQSKALVAAKRMYFGVGGSVDEFIRSITELGGLVTEVEDSRVAGCDWSLMEKSGGVSRWLGRVRLP